MIERESHARFVGYGGMLMELFVAMMALCAACVLDPGIYFAMNSPAAVIGDTPQRAAEVISNWGWVITPETITQTAADVGERTILNRAGGAPTLAVGIAQIMAQAFGGKTLEALLVPLRYPVRSAVHPYRGRRRDAGGPLHDSGSARPHLRAAWPDRVLFSQISLLQCCASPVGATSSTKAPLIPSAA